MALGEAGNDLVALAAADYFFDTKYKRAVMRISPTWFRWNAQVLCVSLYDTRVHFLTAATTHSSSRRHTFRHRIVADYKPVIGYLALHAKVGILPMYLQGTYEAMPKGTTIIKNRDISARIGRFLPYEELEEVTQGMARAEAYRLIAAYVRHEVVNLRDRTRDIFDAKHLRNQMKNERRTPLIESEDVEESAASMI